MTAYPSQIEVGDLLGLGIFVEPEQEAVLQAPGCSVLSVGYLVDRQTDDAQPFRDSKDRPIIIPVGLVTCSPDEVIFPDTSIREHLTVDPLRLPSAVGEEWDEGPAAWGGGSELDGRHYGKPVFDLWPLTEPELAALLNEHEKALERMRYDAHCAYAAWYRGEDDFEDQEHEDQVMSLVEGDHPFEYKIELPRDLAYKWDRLCDISMQGWTALGLTLPASESGEFFTPPWYGPTEGRSPWF